MKWVKQKDGRVHAEVTAQEARQGGLGRPVFYVLVIGLCASLFAFVLLGILA